MSTLSRAVLGVAAAVGALIAGAAATVGAAVLTDRIMLVPAAGAAAEVLVAWTTLGLLAVGRGVRGTAVAALLIATAVATLLALPGPPRSSPHRRDSAASGRTGAGMRQQRGRRHPPDPRRGRRLRRAARRASRSAGSDSCA